jgi:hypothetical protein
VRSSVHGGSHDYGDEVVLAGRHLGAGQPDHGRGDLAGGGGGRAGPAGHGRRHAHPGARQRWTYAELLAEAERAARALTARFEPAFVRPVPGQPAPAAEELHAHCRERLAPYKTPVHWVFVDAFPMTPSGKIQKFRLCESFTGDQPG